MATITATARLSSSVANVSSSCVSYERALRVFRENSCRPDIVLGNWNSCKTSRRFFLLERCGTAIVARRHDADRAPGSANWEPPAAVRRCRACSTALHVFKALNLRTRSIHEDRDEPVVSTESPAQTFSNVSISDIRGGVVALGKFDALHTGHRALVEQAAAMGVPILLSFSGMADVLGWEARLPIAALCDRKRIMAIWAARCGGIIPREYSVEFTKVRSLSPREFVQKLSKELHVKGVVAGANYRFGYKAAGDASDLVHLCNESGLQSFIVDPVMDKDEELSGLKAELSGNSREKGQISSTRVRKALAMGNIERVTNLLGRKHRLVLKLDNCSKEGDRLLVPLRSGLNQYPGEGVYTCSLVRAGDVLVDTNEQAGGGNNILADEYMGTAQVKIGPTWIEISSESIDRELVACRRLLGVEFSCRS